jgi:hypothetical protein
MTPSTTPTTWAELVNFLLGLINLIIPFIFGLLFFVIMWKIIDAWIIHADDETKRGEGKIIALTGVVVFVIMISIWGIINLLKNSVF